jgi:hypothetical protein
MARWSVTSMPPAVSTIDHRERTIDDRVS